MKRVSQSGSQTISSTESGDIGCMRIVIATAHAHLPQTVGGAQSSTNDLALMLIEQGHRVSVLAGLSRGRDWLSLRARVMIKLGAPYATDTEVGYPCLRTPRPDLAIPEVVRSLRPDAFIVQSMNAFQLGRAINQARVPMIFYFRNADFEESALTELQASYVSNSEFTARHFAAVYGVKSVIIPPLVRREAYDFGGAPGDSVVFINPIEIKGLSIALELARRCPDIPFTFVEAWSLSSSEREALRKSLSSLQNVTLTPATRDMKSIYSKARIILAPSKWEEAWGRVATEAQINGIPVLGSAIGGLPEAIGPGGRVVDPREPVEVWERALREMWFDRDEYDRLSSAALRFSRRQQVDPSHQAALLLATIKEEIQRVESAPASGEAE